METKRIILFLLCILSMYACNKKEDELLTSEQEYTTPGMPTSPRGPFGRTVLVYISGENDLSSFISDELSELRKGSKEIGNNALVVYVDDCSLQKFPYVLWIKEGITVDSMSLGEDPLSSAPETMSYILNYTSTYYPANEYGIVLWGHCSGWIIEDSIPANAESGSYAARRGYGIDNGKNILSSTGKWMNISTLSNVLEQWHRLKFIMADCCQFQCIETAYELRNVTDYIIGSPAEVPGKGAPYDTILKGCFEQADTFYQTIVDRYFEQVIPINAGWTYQSRTPLSVIKTSNLPILAKATNAVLHTFLPLASNDDPDTKNLIYYRGNTSNPRENLMYDMNDFILKHTKRKPDSHNEDTAHYKTWKEVFDQTVIYKKNAKDGWLTSGQVSYSVFNYLTDERYGGISMFVPQKRANTWYMPHNKKGPNGESISFKGYNEEIKQTEWYTAARLAEFGW